MIEKTDKSVEKLERHLDLFELVVEEQPIGISNLSEVTEYSLAQVRYSLRQLEEEHLIEPTRKGAVPTDKAKGFIESHDEQVESLISQLESFQDFLEMGTPE